MPKLTCSIMGGLGNQLFQVFALLNLCKDQNLEYEILKSDISPSITPRRTYWNDLFDNLNLVEKYSNVFTPLNEANHLFYTPFPEIKNNYILQGYFQSDKYLISIKDEIFKYIKIKGKDEEIVQSSLKELKEMAGSKELIFVHIRRGDYLRLSHFHYVLPLEYYNKAISNFEKDKTFFVFFSDDIQYCKENFKDLSNKEFIQLEDYQELMLMSYMDGGIIANSSFSWWGAFLLEIRNPNKDNRIIQPGRWFTHGPIYPNDRINNKWKVID